MPIAQNSPKVISYKHINKTAITSQLGIGAIDMNMQKTKKRKAQQNPLESFALLVWVGVQMKVTLNLFVNACRKIVSCLSLDWAIILTTLKTYLLNRDKIEVRD